HAGDKREGHGDDFIAGTHSGGQQRQMQCAGSGIQSDALRSSAISGEFLFKGSDFGAKHEVAALQHSGDSCIYLWLDAVVLRLQVEKGYSDAGLCHSNSAAELLILSRVVQQQNDMSVCVRIDCTVAVPTDFNGSTTPADDLGTAGAKTIHLPACPNGVTGSEPWYYVYITGAGTPEAAKVTGGTCKGDNQAGMLQFTTQNPHSAGYTIGS